MEKLLSDIKNCTTCTNLPMGIRPVMSAHPNSKIVIIGQAPGLAVHNTGIPWNDKSGDNLRKWLAIDKETFYNTELISIIPMGFCYPGTGKTGDLPPRKECAKQWHKPLFDQLKNVELILLIGKYAQDYYLSDKMNLTERVRRFEDYLSNKHFVLPHPSPRNNIWMKKNDWFPKFVLPELKNRVGALIRNAMES